MKVILSILLVFIIMNAGTFIVYGMASAIFGLQPPADGSPARFMISVLLVKVGMALGFVLLFVLARGFWIGSWLRYAFVWWVMYSIVEIGQAVAPDYSALDAGAGIVAEAAYFPLSAFITARLLREKGPEATSA
jgi:hypothetical protein